MLFSTGGAAMKATALSNWQVACFRSAVAALVLALALRGLRLPSREGASGPPAFPWRSRRIWLVALAYGSTLVTFVTANKLTTAANAVFLQAAAPVYLLLAGPWLLNERIHRRDLGYVGVIAAGLVLLFVSSGGGQATAPDEPLGNLVGWVSGITWALTISGLRWVEKSQPASGAAAASAVCGNALAAAACLPLALPVLESRALDWALIAYLGVFQVGLAYILVTRAIGRVTALDASLLLLLEPAASPLWAWIIHGESPGVLAIAGGLLILSATTIRSVRDG